MDNSPNIPAAMVTGGSRGIGRAICLELARLGHAVAVNYAASAAAADEVVSHIVAAGGRAVALQADVAQAGDRAALVGRTVAEFGRLDVLVNNAGIGSPGRLDLLEATEANWDRVLTTNLKAPFFLTQLAARQMLAQPRSGGFGRGKIINISSISAYTASIDRGDYCIAKSAMRMLTWLWAERLAGDGIQVFEICPGVIATDLTAPVAAKYDRLLADGLAPLARWGQPADVARAVGAIVSDCFPYSTGEQINVDGGFHIRRL
ncbi:MAG TPA: 3-ketoacyl-ACP reductase [Pirellulales bacterium]|nr:3-ketoacyl-ACP reductase [Pirellulales bacterium]